MNRRAPRPPPLLVVLLSIGLLAGCRTGTEDLDPAAPTPEEVAPEEGDPPQPDPPEPDPPEPEPADPDTEDPDTGDVPVPSVPPLHPAIDGFDETVVTITTGDERQVRVDAKVAVEPEQRQRGLMEVDHLPDAVGMLFLFDRPRTGGFWMRDTVVPLDIAYVDGDGVIGTILAMDPCEAAAATACPTYPPDQHYRTALEVRQGWFDEVGVAVGAVVSWRPPVPSGTADG